MANITGPVSLHPDHISHKIVVFLGITGAMTLLATASVILRFTSRKLTLFCYWDDWASLGALALSYGVLTTIALSATAGGAGYPVNEYSLLQLEKYLQASDDAIYSMFKPGISLVLTSGKIVLANNVLYNASVTLSKASVLLLYCRIFTVDRSLLIWTRVVGGIVMGYFLAAEFGLVFAYSPVEAQWKVWIPHTSINNKKFWLAMAIVNILLDVIILCLPQARVWRLHLSIHRKVLVSMVFMLGGL